MKKNLLKKTSKGLFKATDKYCNALVTNNYIEALLFSKNCYGFTCKPLTKIGGEK